MTEGKRKPVDIDAHICLAWSDVEVLWLDVLQGQFVLTRLVNGVWHDDSDGYLPALLDIKPAPGWLVHADARFLERQKALPFLPFRLKLAELTDYTERSRAMLAKSPFPGMAKQWRSDVMDACTDTLGHQCEEKVTP